MDLHSEQEFEEGNFNVTIAIFPDRTGHGSVSNRRLKNRREALIWGKWRDIYYCRYSTLSDLEK